MKAGAKTTVKKVAAKKAAPAKKTAAKKAPANGGAASIARDGAREQLDAVSQVMKALADPAVNLDRVADMIVKAVLRLADADSSGFMRRDPVGWVRAATQGFSDERKGVRFDPDTLTLWGRSALSGQRLHVADAKLAEPKLPDAEHRRTRLAVPILRDRASIGVIFVSRDDPGGFDKPTIALVETFADQLAVAMENARLLNETKEALERQTAISEILRVISHSSTEIQPVLDAIAENASRYCQAEDATLMLPDGPILRGVAHFGPVPSGSTIASGGYPIDGKSISGRAFVEGRVVHTADILAEADQYPLGAAHMREVGGRAGLAVPLLHEGSAIGILSLRRREPRAFTEKQIDLLRTFADQAAIAIENVRLFTETKEALERQTATAEVQRAISGTAFDLTRVLDTVIAHATRLTEAENGFVYQVDGDVLEMRASFGPQADVMREWQREHPIKTDHTGSATGRAFAERRTVHIPDVDADPSYTYADAKRLGGFRVLLAVPLISNDRAIGVIALWRTAPRAFSAEQITLVETFADQAVIAIENVRLFDETKESLERQTAISEILRAISSSPTDVQPVLDTIAESAARFCGADDAGVVVIGDDGHGQLTATHDRVPQAVREFSLGGRSVTARSIQNARLYNVADIEALSDDEFGDGKEYAREFGYRAFLSAPLLKNGRAIGCIQLRRNEPSEFSPTQVDLVQTFAAQAVIALDNVRLFNETKEALERQTAIGDILRVISGSVTDIQPVLDAIAASAARFAAAEDASVLLVRGDRAVTSAHYGPLLMPPSVTLERGWVAGRAIVEVRTIQLADATVAGDEYPHSRDAAIAGDHRAVLAAPLVRDGRPLGVIVLRRRDPRLFSDRQVELVQTFADQAAIAIENVRLFNETKEALERQTAISDILKVISGSPTDIQPVLDAIASSAARFASAEDASVMLVKDGELQPAAHQGPVAIPSSVRLDRGSVAARAVLDARTVHAADVTQGDEFPLSKAFALGDGGSGQRAVLAAPLIRGTTAIGAIVLRRLEPRAFSDRQIDLVQTFADQAVIALANTRLFKETQDALERQTATAELLAAMSQSAFDLKPVFEMVLEKSLALCRAEYGWIRQFDPDGSSRTVAARRPTPLRDVPRDVVFSTQGSKSILARSYRERRTVHVADVAADPTVSDSKSMLEIGARTGLGVPLLRGEEVLGVVILVRLEVRPFDAREIELVESFARQAAIAIENVRLFNEIQEKSAQLEVANRHKSEFLANMSHELRTPLNAVIGFSDVLIQRMFGELNEQQADYLEDIRSSGTHLLSLINDILDLSKIEAGRMELELAPFSLVAALNNAVTLVRERAQGHGIKLELDVAPALDTVVADERKLKQVVVNLLANAVKFTPDGGTVRLHAERDNGHVRLAVHDTGIGVAPEDQERIFEEFQQAGHQTERSREGTGLGLALSKRMVELHGGTISLESEPGKGSTFTVALPLKEA